MNVTASSILEEGGYKMEPTKLDQISRILQTVSAWAVSVTAIVAALSAVFKPFRNALMWVFKKLFGERKNPVMQEIRDMESRLGGKIDNITTKVDALEEQMDKNEIDRIRQECLGFANQCRREQNHSIDEFRHILELDEKYIKLLEKTGAQNGVFEADMAFIKKEYAKKLEENSFLR